MKCLSPVSLSLSLCSSLQKSKKTYSRSGKKKHPSIITFMFMAISTLNRFISSTIRLNSPAFSLTTRITLSSIADKYYTHFLNHIQNPEKTLVKIEDKLDALSVIEVLNRFSTNNPELGLRFFIWAGVQSKYRHSNYMYGFACSVFQISRNPGRVREVLEAYRDEGCVVSVKLFKVVLNLCKEGRVCDEALWVLRKMEGEFNCRPDLTMYNVVIGLFCEKGDIDMVIGLMREIERKGLLPNMITYMSMIKCFCSVGRVEDACLLFKTMKSHGCAANLVAYSALLDGFCRFGSFDRALELLGEMEKEGGNCGPNVIIYTSVIQSLCENGKSIEALPMLERMERYNCQPNRVTICVLVKGFCSDGYVDEARKLVERIGAEGHVSRGECYSFLVIGLLNVKKFEEAEKVFKWMINNDLRPDGVACSIMLKELCAKGRFLDAFHTFEDVEKKGFAVTIDSVIYSTLLVGLSHEMNVVEVAKLSSLICRKGIQVKDHFREDVKAI